MARLNLYLKDAFDRRASDIHFSAGEPVRYRIDGDLVPVDDHPMDQHELQELLLEILSDGEKQKLQTNKNLDKSYSVPEAGNFRVNIFMTRRGLAAVLRTIPSKIPKISDLGLPPVVETFAALDKGLVLVTGPTGSGKSTTLAAILNHINENCPYHILTVEDPVEFVHESKCSLINQREIGASCLTFADALKYALREDPDVILVGEMRDLETIGLALTAAETGHLVFGTLHTRGAGASVDRIIDSFPANQQAMVRTMLSESLAAVISQALLKKKDGKGRVAAYEILVANHAISNLIREGKTFQMASIIQTGRKEGMVLMDQSLIELVKSEKVTKEEAAGYMENPGLIGMESKPHNSVSEQKPPAKPTSLPSPRSVASPKAPIASPATEMSQPKPAAAPIPASRVVAPPPPIPTPAPGAAKSGAVPPASPPKSAGLSFTPLEQEEIPTPKANLNAVPPAAPKPPPLSLDADLLDKAMREADLEDGGEPPSEPKSSQAKPAVPPLPKRKAG